MLLIVVVRFVCTSVAELAKTNIVAKQELLLLEEEKKDGAEQQKE